MANLAIGRVTSIKDELNRTTSFAYDGSGRLQRVTQPEGNYVEYSYDARGNVTQTQAVAKSGSGLATIATSAAYAASCANPKTCNKPVSTTDARGQVTDYVYDATHGGLLSVTAPAAPGGVRPQTRYSYTLTASPLSATQHPGAYLLTGVSACQTGSSCAGTADEVKSTTAYGANMLPTAVSNGNGSGTLTATAAMSYDAAGNLLTADGPLAGTGDTVRYRYDLARQRVGTVSPDPDGAGALKHRAQRVTYNADGQPTKLESGTVADQSDAAWAAFAPLEAVETGYDAYARATTQKLVAGGTVHALTQTSYDALGRAECTAQRMNPAAFASLPASACSLGAQGSFGPDRIVKAVYNAAGEVTQQRVAVGTADEAAEVSATYRPNGGVETVTDGENNKTTYVYDGHDRLSQTQYPSATKGAGVSNAADYEQLGYDAAGNVTSRRVRDGQAISFVYDALNRLTYKDGPNVQPAEGDVSFAYDNLGRLVGASASNGYSGSFAYDALGRQISQGGNWAGANISAYDLAGRRTRLTYRDGFYVDYDYLVTGEMSAIRENGGLVLAGFGYDDLGRRTSLTRGNGTVTSYGYDPVSRLASLAQDLGGGAHDLTLGFSYNPAGQIHSNTRSNDAYAWTGHGSGTTASTANGLNQLASQGGTALSHDGNGNITFDGTRTFGYTAENRMATTPAGILFYDPMGGLYAFSAVHSIFDNDGTGILTEVDSGTGLVVRRRYVHGPGVDEPLVWYEGAGTSDRRYLHADERGSIVTVSDNAGNAIAINRYDEYGKPAATNIGRFQYTGQAWLPEIGLYYYKARMYNPFLPRFMQPDPIGYGDGMNMYAYVKGDPVNFVDPLGLETITITGYRRARLQNARIESSTRSIRITKC